MARSDTAPDSLKRLLARKSRGTATLPQFAEKTQLTIGASRKPSLQLDPVKGHEGLWNLTVGGLESHNPAQRLRLDRRPRRRRSSVTSAFRPRGAATNYLPRLSTSRRQSLFRVSGKAVRPLSEHILGDNDDRAILTDYSYPFRCVGPVGDGTGALIGPRLVLTAAHCIDLSSRYSTTFTPGKNNAGARGSVPSARVDAWLYGSDDRSVCANDFAIGVLSEPLGLSLGWFGTRSFRESWIDIPHFTHVGMRGGLLPSWQSGLSVEDVDNGPFDTMELETLCDSESGQSGGPLFAYWGGDPYIVGVLSGYEEEFTYTFPLGFTAEQNVFAGGPGMVERVLQMRAEYD